MNDTGRNPDRIKIALIPVLGLVLLWLVAGGEGETPVAAELATSSTESASVANPKNSRAKRTPNVSWPSESLQLIASHNPFELTDPRVEIDNLFREYGLLNDPVLTEVEEGVFFAEVDSTDQQDDRFLDDLWDDLLATTDGPLLNSDSPTDAGLLEGNSKVNSQLDSVLSAEEARQMEREKRLSEAKQQFDQLKQRLTELQSQKVTMIMESRQGKSALLGDRHVAEGELVEAGIRVASISGDGITFEIETPIMKFD